MGESFFFWVVVIRGVLVLLTVADSMWWQRQGQRPIPVFDWITAGIELIVAGWALWLAVTHEH